MWTLIKGLGTGGLIGALCGVGLVIWVEPTTSGGTAILILLPAIAGAVFAQIARALFGSKSHANQPNGSPDQR